VPQVLLGLPTILTSQQHHHQPRHQGCRVVISLLMVHKLCRDSRWSHSCQMQLMKHQLCCCRLENRPSGAVRMWIVQGTEKGRPSPQSKPLC
jgi:hypothetical protein